MSSRHLGADAACGASRCMSSWSRTSAFGLSSYSCNREKVHCQTKATPCALSGAKDVQVLHSDCAPGAGHQQLSPLPLSSACRRSHRSALTKEVSAAQLMVDL